MGEPETVKPLKHGYAEAHTPKRALRVRDAKVASQMTGKSMSRTAAIRRRSELETAPR
jgi:hypothetical protein